MRCVRCQHECPPTARFCQECGAALARNCSACGNPVALDVTYCGACGTPLNPLDHSSEDRRQATALFADISGYTAQCARSDPEQVQAMLNRFYAAMEGVVARYGGQIFNRIGDAVMAVFGAPIAHGNDPERALRVALDMHSTAADLVDCDGLPLVLHIGIARGEVVAATIGSGINSKYSITGDAVNLAARLEALANPGDTLISDALYGLVSSLVDAENLGTHTIKGLATPVLVWRVRRLCTASAPLSPFVGRHLELLQIAAALDRSRLTGKGVTILVRGNAGIGKSRLVTEIRTRANLEGFDVPLGQVLDFGVAKGKAAVPVLLKTILGVAAPGGEPDTRAALQCALDSGVVLEHEGLLIGALLELDLSAAEKAMYDAMDKATRVQQSDQALAALLQRAARIRPMLVTVEDIHWASGDLLRQLAAIARAVAHVPMVLVMTSRIEGDPLDQTLYAALQGGPLLTFELAPLGRQEASRLASEWADVTSNFARRCLDRAEGNPLFLEHLLRAPHGGEPADVPPTIQSLVLEQMDRLAPLERTALQSASVIGKRFSAGGLRAITGDSRDYCGALLAADMIRLDGDEFQFAHALVQEAVYGSILKSRKRTLHRQAAQWIGEADPVLRAEHLDRADDPDAASAYLLAARHEMQHFRTDAATSLAQRGVALAREPSVGCELSLLCAELLRESGQSADSITACRSALDLASDDVQRCHAWMEVAAGYRVTGDFLQAVDALSQAQPLAERLHLDVECSRIHHMRGNLYFARGDVPACEAEHWHAFRFAQQSGNPECEVRALSGLGDAQLEQGHLFQALESFRRCVALCEERGWISIEIPNRCMIGHCLQYAAMLADAVTEIQRALADARKVGLVPAQVFALMSLATVLVDAGRIHEAEPVCVEGLSLARRAGARRFESSLLLSLADVRIRQGRRDEAMQEINAALTLARETGMGFAGAATFGMLARAAQNAEERAQALRDGEALLMQPCLAHSVLRFYINAIEASIEAAEWDETLRYAETLEAFMCAEPLPWALLVVARARALRDVAIGADEIGAWRRLACVRQDVLAAGLGSVLATIDTALTESGAPGTVRRQWCGKASSDE